MIANAGARFWTEASLASMAAMLGLVTLIWQEWIEAIFRVDPDGGDGSLEWVIVAAFFAAAIKLALMARADAGSGAASA